MNRTNDNYEDEALLLKKALQSKDENNSLTMMDFTPNSGKMLNRINTFAENASEIDVETYKKYKKYGIEWDSEKFKAGILDVELARRQSNWEKLGHALEQTVVNEVVLGTALGFSDLFDIVVGEVFKSDNDYQNPVSVYLENLQEEFRKNHDIYQDPTKTGWKDWSDFGWWMNNVPSIMSSLTLMIPGAGVGKAVSYAGKLAGKGLRKSAAFTRKAFNASKRSKVAEDLPKIGKLENWLNRPNVGLVSNRILESGTTALAMRMMENYQESRQVYDDMMGDIVNFLDNASDSEKEKFIQRNKDLFDSLNIDTNDNKAMAKAISKEAADKTFVIDLANLTFDVIQVATLGNPLKIPKNLRTTAKVNKAQREAKILSKFKTVEEGETFLANRSFKDKALDWLSDHSKAGWIITSELTEGLEESINYIAQQEGINYGNLMFDPTRANINTIDRWNSYLTNSELYESAFWGVLGGVMFQHGGSKIKRIYGATVNTISKNRKFNEETLEGNDTGVKTSWKKEYDLAEDALRTEEINSRYSNLENLKKKRSTIYDDGKSPFEDDSPEQGKLLDLNTQLEKDVTWQRAVDDFIVNQTFKAIDAGNFDLLKEYLRDPDVIKHIEELTLDEHNPAPKIDVNQLIKRMDEVEKIYTDYLISVNAAAGSSDNVPFEYVNAIARDNTKSKIKIQRIEKKIESYEESAEANEFRFKNSLEEVFGQPVLDYKTAIDLITVTNFLRELRAAKQEILDDKKRKGSIEGQNTLYTIDSRINTLTNYVANLSPAFTNFSTDPKLFGVINSLVATQLSLPEDSDEYNDFIRFASSRDIGNLSKLSGVDFKLTDDDIVKVFGEEGTENGSFYYLKKELTSHFGVDYDSETKVSKFVEAAPNLADDYSVISALSISKEIERSKIADTEKTVNNRIQALHNSMNEARVLAIQNSRDILVKQAKKYGRKELLDYVFENSDLQNVSPEDKKEIDDAITVLNLTNPNNKNLNDIIATNILLGDYEKSVNNANERKKSSTSQKREGKANEQKTTNNTDNNKKSANDNKSGENGQTDDNNISNQTRHIKVSGINTDGGITYSFVGVNEEDSIPFKEVDLDGEEGYELLVDDTDSVDKNLRDELTSNTDIFEGYDPNNKNKYRIVKNPILAKANNNKLYVYDTGLIEYKQSTTVEEKEKPDISSKGEEDKGDLEDYTEDTGDYNTDDYNPEDDRTGDDFSDEEFEKEQAKLEEANRILDLIQTLRDECLDVAEEFQNSNRSNEELYKAVEEKVNKFREETEYDDKYEPNIQAVLELIGVKPDLINIAKVVNDLRSSTLVEKKEGKYTQGFINKVYSLIEEYAKVANIPKSNTGKYYINFEDFIRNINNLYSGVYEGEAIYTKLRNFLTSNYNNLVVVIDDINDSNLLDNARKPIEERIKERIGARSNYRVGIDEFFDNPTEEFLKAFDSLKIDDKVKLKMEDGRYYIKKGNTNIGIIGIPVPTSDNTGYTIVNKGWETTVFSKDSGRISPLRTVLSNLAYNDNLNNIINSIIYGNLSSVDKQTAINNAFEIVQPLSNDLLSKNSDPEKAIDFICNIWKYRMGAVDFSKPSNQRSIRIDAFIDALFEKLYDSYEAINQLSKQKKKDIEIRIAHINDGELIRCVDEKDINLKDTRKSRDNYDKFTQSNQAFKHPKDCKIGVVTKQNTLTLEGNNNETHTKLGVGGTIHVIIPNRSGIPQYCIATSVVTTDANLDINSDAYKIIKASRRYLNDVVDEYIKDQSNKNYKNLSVVISDLMRHDKHNASLFAGIGVKIDPNGTISLTSGKKNLIIYRKSITSAKDFEYRSDGEELKEYSYSDDGDVLKDAINKFFDDCFFNLDFKFVQSSWNIQNNSTIGYKDNGKFCIRISNYFGGTYANLSQAFIQGGLLRVNTRLENGSNYRRKGEKQGANQILEVSFNKITTSPVEKNIDNNSDIETTEPVNEVEERTGEDILNTEDANDAVDELVKIALPNLNKNDEKSLKDFGLLPKSIIFAEELKDKDGNPAVAENNLTTGTIKVSRLFLDMYDGIGDYASDKDFYRKQAIRKLIHEQIHTRIKQEGRDDILKQIEDIYNQFEENYNSWSNEDKDTYKGFLFKDKTKKEERLEEFLVESITAINLANKLNEIEAKYEEGELDKSKIKETIWDKILNIIAKIFNYNIFKDGKVNINKKSLLQKELYALAGALNVNNETENNNNNDLLDDNVLDDEVLDGDSFYSTNVEKVKNDINNSVLTESAPKHSSTSEFVSSFDPSIQPEIIKLINSGEISSICKN